MTDTEILSAIIKYNISIVHHDNPQEGELAWWCHYKDRVMYGSDLRKLLNCVILDITTEGQLLH